MKSFVELHSLLPKGVKLMPEDVFARASFVLSAKVLDPQFQGQIKERLNSRDAVRLVGGYARPPLELWQSDHVAGRYQHLPPPTKQHVYDLCCALSLQKHYF